MASRLRRFARLAWPPALASIITLLLGWRGDIGMPAGNLDASWQAGLHMAAHSNLNWGTDIMFTYGPLGWLRVPTYWYSDTAALSLLYLVVTRLVLFGVLWQLARRSFGWLGALLLLVPIAWMVTDPLAVLGFALAVWLVTGTPAPRIQLACAGVLGLLAGLEFLCKINVGVTIGVLGAIAALLTAGGAPLAVRRVAAWSGGLLAALIMGWLGSGQALGALPEYAVNALRIAGGYSQVMMTESGDSAEYWYAGVVALGVAVAIWLLVEGPRRMRAVVLLLWATWAFLFFKAAYVRHDAAHTYLYFAAAVPVLLALRWRATIPCRLAGLGVILLVASSWFIVTDVRFDRIVAPRAHVSAAADEIAALWHPSRRADHVRAGRETVRQHDRLDADILRALRGRTVHVAPVEAAIIWAYELKWAPEPVFQGYQAYTQGLDGLNADQLAGPDAPERILYQPGVAIDGRFASFDTPASVRQRLCRYRPEIRHGDAWIVLARRPDACATPRLVGSVRAAWGELVGVPEPSASDALVYVRVAGARVGGLERLRSLAFRAYERHALLGDRVYRVAPGVLGDGLPLRAGTTADFPKPFNVAAGTTVFGVDRQDHPRHGRPLRFDFYEVRDGGMPPPRRTSAAERAGTHAGR